MKHVLLGLTVFACTQVFSQTTDGVIGKSKPEKVYSIAMEVKPGEWYLDQSDLWKAEVEKNPKNGDAWLNYYAASRALRNLLTPETELQKIHAELCNKIVLDAKKAIPETFESYFMDYIQNEGAGGSPELLLKAAALRPYDSEILDEMMIHYHMVRNQAKFEEYGTQMLEENAMPTGMLNWGYNLLSELDENAILFTCGDNDTYSAWIVQAAKKYRKDVTVVNTFLIQVEEYRTKLLQELGFPNFEHKKATTYEEELANLNSLYEHFFNGKRPVYVATTAISYFEKDYSDKLFLTGLAYKYSEAGFDNESVIRRNYEKRYLLDYLKEVFAHNIGDLKAQEFNGTYLPSMILLYQQYARSEELTKMAELEILLLKIAEQNGRQNEVLELLSGSDKPTPMLSAVLDLKELEKNMIKVNGNVYMDRYETTQGDYNRFLQNLQRSGNNLQYAACLYDSTQWVKRFPYAGNDPMVDLYHWHPAYVEYPVVNISYEAAKAYCEWLTKQYNLQRKRTYTQVVFRLPTLEEWRTAAGSGNAKAITPFPKNEIKNSSGCYLGNIQTSPGRFFDDGGFHMVKVTSYNPNDLGFFNTFGNVAELTSTKGKVIGGSWYNLFEDCTFDKTIDVSGPDPGVGFRIVMEIIEE